MSEAITIHAVANTANFLATLCLHKRDGCRDKTAPEHWFQGWGLILWLPAPEPFRAITPTPRTKSHKVRECRLKGL